MALRSRRSKRSPAKKPPEAQEPVTPATTPIPGGFLAVPGGWGLQTEVRLVEPAEKLEATLSMKSKQNRPRANLSLVRHPSTSDDVNGALMEHLANLGKTSPGFKVHSNQVFEFADGAQGAGAFVRHEPLPGFAAVQFHLFRWDDSIMTHFTVSAAESAKNSIEERFFPVIRSFHP